MKLSNIRDLPLEDLRWVSGGVDGPAASSGGGTSTRGGETSGGGTRYAECGAGRNGGPVICAPNKE